MAKLKLTELTVRSFTTGIDAIVGGANTQECPRTRHVSICNKCNPSDDLGCTEEICT